MFDMRFLEHIRRQAISLNAVKHLVLLYIEQRQPCLDLVNVDQTSLPIPDLRFSFHSSCLSLKSILLPMLSVDTSISYAVFWYYDGLAPNAQL